MLPALTNVTRTAILALRNRKFVLHVVAPFSDHFKDVPTHFLVADVCRPELLLELEGVGRIV